MFWEWKPFLLAPYLSIQKIWKAKLVQHNKLKTKAASLLYLKRNIKGNWIGVEDIVAQIGIS